MAEQREEDRQERLNDQQELRSNYSEKSQELESALAQECDQMEEEEKENEIGKRKRSKGSEKLPKQSQKGEGT